MSEFTPPEFTPGEQLVINMAYLIEKAEPGSSEYSAIVDFSNLAVAENHTKLLRKSMGESNGRDYILGYFQIARTKRTIADTKAAIKSKRKSNPEYGDAIGLLANAFNKASYEDNNPPLNATRNMLLLSILELSLRD